MNGVVQHDQSPLEHRWRRGGAAHAEHRPPPRDGERQQHARVVVRGRAQHVEHGRIAGGLARERSDVTPWYGHETVTTGGSGPPSSPRSEPATESKTNVGTAMAVSFNQYWNAWTKVIERIPPDTTLTITIAPTTNGPTQTGTPKRVFRARPAP